MMDHVITHTPNSQILHHQAWPLHVDCQLWTLRVWCVNVGLPSLSYSHSGWRMLMEESRQRLGREYKYSVFPKLTLCHLAFMRDLLVLVSLTERNWKGIFAFTKKSRKAKLAPSLYIIARSYRQLVSLSNRSDTSKLLPGNYVIFQHQAITALNDVCEHLHFYLDLLCASIRNICPKVTVSLEGFHRNTLHHF